MREKHASFDLINLFLGEIEIDIRKKTYELSIEPVKLADDVIVKEDGKKFRDYFIKHKHKEPSVIKSSCSVEENSEKLLNKELIEQHQETIIEQEENCPPYRTIPEQKYIREATIRKHDKRKEQSKSDIICKEPELCPLNVFTLKSRNNVWFLLGEPYFLILHFYEIMFLIGSKKYSES